MLLFMDGMAHYDTPRIPMKYSAVSTGGGTTWTIAAEGRFVNALKRTTVGGGSDPGYVAIAPLMSRTGLWTPTNAGVCGFACKVDDLTKILGYTFQTGVTDLFVVVEGNAKHVSVSLQPDGTFLLRGREQTGIGGEVLLAQSVEGMQSNNWCYLEFKWLIDATVGRFTLRMNGMTLIDFTGNTMQQWILPSPLFTGVWTSVHIGGFNSASIIAWFGDLYLADQGAVLASDVHDFLGDGMVATIMPDGVGATTGWTPTGAANWDTQNDRPAPDDDATYVRALDPDLKDTYQFEDIPPGALVKGAQLSVLARKEGEGSVMLAPVARPPGSTDFIGPTQGVASVAYDRFLTQPYDGNPATLAAWTASEINTSQFGVVKVT